MKIASIIKKVMTNKYIKFYTKDEVSRYYLPDIRSEFKNIVYIENGEIIFSGSDYQEFKKVWFVDMCKTYLIDCTEIGDTFIMTFKK